MDDNKIIRNRLFDLCNDARLSANATINIMDSATNYFTVDDKGKIQALDKRWLSPEDYVSENAKHIAKGNTEILGQANPKNEEEKLYAQLAKLSKAGDTDGYRKLRQKQRSSSI